MDPAGELSQFLTSRRAKVTPDEAGLPSYGQRRVPGLRREEVASLAGVSVEYYKRLERGNATGASDQVLDALADALRLDDAERAHLFDLARAAAPAGSASARRRSRPVQQRVRPVVQRILDSLRSRSGNPHPAPKPKSDIHAPTTRPVFRKPRPMKRPVNPRQTRRTWGPRGVLVGYPASRQSEASPSRAAALSALVVPPADLCRPPARAPSVVAGAMGSILNRA